MYIYISSEVVKFIISNTTGDFRKPNKINSYIFINTIKIIIVVALFESSILKVKPTAIENIVTNKNLSVHIVYTAINNIMTNYHQSLFDISVLLSINAITRKILGKI
jgi:hypothetical protein